MAVIRWNPHTYKDPKGKSKKKREERLQLMIKLKRYIRKHPPSDKIHVYYMFYDQDNPLIVKNIPCTMIWDGEDIELLASH